MAPAGLKLRQRHHGRAAAEPGERHSRVAVNEGIDAHEVALHGAAAVVHDVAGHPCGREPLRARVERAAA